MKITDRARKLRKVIEQTAQALDDTNALDAIELFPEWEVDVTYKASDKIRYKKILYRCLQDHTSQADWTPDTAVSLFARVLIPDPEIIPDWVQPDATNAYMKGDKVRYEGDVYVSLIDNNIWSPAAYPAGWQKLLTAE